MKTTRGWYTHFTFLEYGIDLAKQNSKCHMNYSIIFTEISFSPETSSSSELIHCGCKLDCRNKRCKCVNAATALCWCYGECVRD